MDLWDYFHTDFEHTGSDREVTGLSTDQACRFGDRRFGYPIGTNADKRPDRFSAGEGGEPILFDQTNKDDYVRGVFYSGEHRTYAQGISLVNISENDDFDRTEFVGDILSDLTGYGGTFYGTVVSKMYGTPVEGAEVRILDCNRVSITDVDGRFCIGRMPVETFTVSVERWGYTPIDEAEFTFAGEMELEAEIEMLHPELDINPEMVEVVLDMDLSTTRSVDITNTGDGPLEFATSARAARAEGGFWDQLEEMNTGEITGDIRLQAAVYSQDHFWVAGGNRPNHPNMLYKVTRDGELVDSWEQQSESSSGWRNLCTDGEYIYGVDSDYIAQFDTETGQVTDTQIETGLDPCWVVTWDDVNSLFWVSSLNSDIYGIDRDGNRIHIIENNWDFYISGMFYFEDDPDGYNLYIMSWTREGLQQIWRCDIESGEAVHVTDLAVVEDEETGCCTLTNELYPFTWALVVQMKGAEDWARIYEASSDFYWLDISPTGGTLEPNASLELEFTFDTNGLEVSHRYEAYIQFEHNTPVVGSLWIDVSLTIPGQSAPDPGGIPLEFGLTGIYPNPFNSMSTVSFSLDRTAEVHLTICDLAGRQIAALADGCLASGSYNVPVKADSWPSGIYMVRLSDGARVEMRKITLLR